MNQVFDVLSSIGAAAYCTPVSLDEIARMHPNRAEECKAFSAGITADLMSALSAQMVDPYTVRDYLRMLCELRDYRSMFLYVVLCFIGVEKPVPQQPERGTITDPYTGLEYSDSTLILSLDPDMTEDTFAVLLEKYGLHTVYDYDSFTMAAVGTEKPCTADELDRLIVALSGEEGVLGVEKDNVIRLTDPILADG